MHIYIERERDKERYIYYSFKYKLQITSHIGKYNLGFDSCVTYDSKIKGIEVKNVEFVYY